MIRLFDISIIKYYYVLVVLFYFLAIYMPFIRVGLLMSFIMGYGIFILYKNKKVNLRKGLDVLVLIYLAYNLLTIFFYLFSGIPVSVFFREFSNSILPIIPFYFFGRLNYDNSFFKLTTAALAFCFLIGFYYQFTLPMSYMQRMHVIDNSGTNPLGYISNYRSLFGLTTTASLASISMFISFSFIFKYNSNISKLFFIICALALILTFRRSALYSSVFALALFNVIVLLKFKSRVFKLLFFESLFIILVIIWIINVNPEFLSELIERFYSLSSAIGQRSDSWLNGLSNTKSIITGDGLGRYGHKVMEYSDLYIPDGNYFRMIAEIGIFGFIIFLSIIFLASYKALVKIKTHYVQLIILLMICLQAVGSDMFSFQLVAPIFWYSIGACNKLKLSAEKKELTQINKLKYI